MKRLVGPSALRCAAAAARSFCTSSQPTCLVTKAIVGERSNVALLKLDDGKMNAFSFDMLNRVHSALDSVDADCGAVVLTGNGKAFSAGFDLSVMGKGPSQEAGVLLQEGADLLFRLLEYPKPLIMAANGHALALGAIVLLTGDLRIGTSNTPKCKVGTNEVHIGMPLPRFGIELAKARLHPSHLTRAATLGFIYDPEGAVEAGYLDLLAAPGVLEATAIAHASKLAHLGAQGDKGAFHLTKLFEREDLIARCNSALKADVVLFER